MARISDDNSDMNSNDEFHSSSAEDSIDSSDDDSIIDVGNDEIDFRYAVPTIKSSAKRATLKKPLKNEKNKKRHHNASEKVRRTQLKSCFIALKNTIGHPDTSNNEALKIMAQEIDKRQAESKRLDEEIKKVQREIIEQERMIKKSRTK